MHVALYHPSRMKRYGSTYNRRHNEFQSVNRPKPTVHRRLQIQSHPKRNPQHEPLQRLIANPVRSHAQLHLDEYLLLRVVMGLSQDLGIAVWEDVAEALNGRNDIIISAVRSGFDSVE